MADGFVLINKKINVTSRSVDNTIQRLFHNRKVGHLGTLDPFASGLLVIAIGKGCKVLPFIDDSFKTYRAVFVLGKKTDTGDLTGQVIEEKDVLKINESIIKKVFDSFIGDSEQIPPMRSALHHEGERLYDLARKGIEVERKARKIYIKSLDLLSFSKNCIEFAVNCSRGTYVRTLGEDIANKLNTVGYLSSLERTSIGNISLAEAVSIDELKETDLINPVKLISLKQIIVSDEETIQSVKSGKRIRLNEKEEKILLVEKINGELTPLAVYNLIEENLYSPVRGLF